MRPTRAIGPALGVSLVLLAGACGDDTSGPDGPESTATESPSAEETGASTAPVDPVDFGTEPELSESYREEALRATDDDLITMVPTTLPEGWTTVGGGYTPDPQWWRMEFTSPAGEVSLDQLPGTGDDALADAGLTAVDDVDLSDWGTGTWSAWDNSGAAVMAYDLKGSTVVLQGPDAETVRSLAESVLPAEDAGEQEG